MKIRKKESAKVLMTASIRRGLEAQSLGKHQMTELFCREEASTTSIIQYSVSFKSLTPSSLDRSSKETGCYSSSQSSLLFRSFSVIT